MAEMDISQHLIEAIATFEETGSYEEKELANLYRGLRETKSARLFAVRAREVASHVKNHSCFNGFNEGSVAWHVARGLLFDTFLRHVDDSHTVAEILKCLGNYRNPRNFTLMDDDLIGLKLPSDVAEQRTRMGLKSFNFLSYFLHHANESQLILCGKRFISLVGWVLMRYASGSVTMDVINKAFSCMPTLLQHAASLEDTWPLCKLGVPFALMHLLLEIIDYGSHCQLWERRTLSFLVDPSQFNTTMKDLCLSFRVILRDVMNPHEATFLVAGFGIRHSEIPHVETLLPFYEKLFPGCFYGHQRPPSLRHMCRYIIRKQLYDNWKIPSGIDHLPIPSVMKDYINLLKD